MAYFELEPFGTGIEDQRMALICATVLNGVLMANSDPKKKVKWFKPEDFVPDYFNEKQEEEKKPQTIEEQLQVLKAIAGVRE